MQRIIPFPSLDLAVGRRPAPQHPLVPWAELELTQPAQLAVTCRYIPAKRGRPTLSNGDPGYPGTPAEVELLAVTAATTLEWVADGARFTLDPGTELLTLLTAEQFVVLRERVLHDIEQAIEDAAGEAYLGRTDDSAVFH